jgi:hypothetical protein
VQFLPENPTPVSPKVSTSPELLRIEGRADDRVCREELAQSWIIDTGIEIDGTDAVHLLLTGKATGGETGGGHAGGGIAAIGIARFTVERGNACKRIQSKVRFVIHHPARRG